ncbi:hypothetical protein C8J57DRAFT_1197699 [Mycena rebaudengoi]|nr:hypothetical protein C8J57DRAFT_1197699 [Mycena rebaudengoi]
MSSIGVRTTQCQQLERKKVGGCCVKDRFYSDYLQDNFDAIPDGPNGVKRVKCLLCSAGTVRSVEMVQTSISAHKKTAKHKDAVLEQEDSAARASELATAVESRQHPASMALADRFAPFSDEEDFEMEEQLADNPFQGAIAYGDDLLDASGDPVLFSAGNIRINNNSGDKLWAEMDGLEYYGHTILADKSVFLSELLDSAEDSTITGVAAALASMGLDESDEEEEAENEKGPRSDFNTDWAPHGSKAMFMLDMLDNFPRMRLSDDHMKTVMWVMKELGTPDIPSFYALRKLQEKLRNDVGLKPQHHVSPHQFYMNHPNDLICLDFANLLVRNLIHFYPKISSTVSESWQAAKYVDEIDLNELLPMWADWKSAPYRHFYIKELAQCKDGSFIIPFKWIVVKGSVHAQGHSVTREHVSKIYVTYLREYFVRFCSTSPHASSLEQFEALTLDCNQIEWNSVYDCALSREVLFRVRAHLLPADNPQQAEWTSTAGSNSTWWCREDMSGGSDAHRETDDGYHALFGTVTPRTPAETIDAIKRQIKAACTGVAEAVKKPQTESGVKDKISSHWINLLVEKARLAQQERVYNRATRDPRLNNSKIRGVERAEIKDAVVREIQEELYSWVIMQPEEHYEKLDLNSRDGNLRAGDHYNILLHVCGLSPHRDSPCEILHTVLLGEDKYVWHETNKAWSSEQDALFATRLQSSSVDGLSLLPLRAQYLVQYKNSLIGKHFKVLQQLGAFHLDSKLCSPEVINLWKANRELGAMLWYPEIKDMNTYLADLQILVDNILDRWAIVDLTRIIKKFKLHVLPHAPEHIRRFGPAILFSTEVFECWNAVFRLCSVLSNHQAPSLDIATTLGDMERFKHQVSGGWWKPESSEEWIQAGPKVCNFLTSNSQLQRRLGWTDSASLKPGMAKVMSKAKRTSSSWKDALGIHWRDEMDHQPEASVWDSCKYVVSRSGDPCMPGSWIFFKAADDEAVIAGRIAKILLPSKSLSTATSRIIIEEFNVSATNDPRMNMPLLLRTGRTLVISAKNILFKFNAQHDCLHCKCPFVNVAGARQERQASTLTCRAISHSEDNRYHLNMHALHNAHLIRETLPRHLTTPKPCFTDRREKHSEFAAVLRETGPAKRAEAVAKTHATKQRNKKDKEEKLAGARERGGGIDT